ncbi:MAG: hypothetical protein KGI50_05460 [Patescibacteria group bacterium]|nr:hypothetical protein [Patescibacteria group bacterium]MDE2438747.1 hypothetical protein [Patescibacteria group bacterium]
MNIKDYKLKYSLKSKDLAKRWKVSAPTICHWISGYSKPTKKNAVQIFISTKGEISLKELGYDFDLHP